MEVGVLMLNGGFLAFNKPAGMCSQGPMTCNIPELWELIKTRYRKGSIAHRIDKFTPGIRISDSVV